MLRTLQALPPKGSLQEWALILLIDRLEDIEHARLRALAQILIDKEEGAKAFDEYMNIAFPSMAQRKAQQNKGMVELLKAWTGTGPLRVTPMEQPGITSRLRTRAIKVEDERAARIYAKIRRR